MQIFGKLGRVSGAGLAWRVGWLFARFVVALVLWLLFALTLVVELVDDHTDTSAVVGLIIATTVVTVPLIRYTWRLLRLRHAGTEFVAFTPGGVRAVDAAAFASIPWRVIRQATLRSRGRRTWLCLAIDAHVPADISWAVLQASPAEQVVPGCTVLELRMPVGEAPAEDIGTGLDLGGSVPFDPVRWPDRSRA